ncbi:MAG: 6-bladed beta-propeller [Saprospiraceae bacterium]|nr:6-bladed beta-propeller [Saprospiraceae bacterium]
MQRRPFLKSSAMLGFGILSGAWRNSGATELVFGQNERRYTFDRDWVKATPASLPVKDCHEMVQTTKGHILLLTNETRNNLISFDKSGKVLSASGNAFPGGHGLSMAGEGSDQVLFVTDTELNQVFKTDPNGKVIQSWKAPMDAGLYTDPKQFVPTETTVLPNGEFYVADGYGQQYVLHYGADGQLKNSFGGRGEGDAHLDNAHGICVDNRGTTPTLLVTDRTRCCFKRFSLKGEYLEKIELPGACVCRPVIKGGYLYAAVLRSPHMGTESTGFVIILNKENKVVSVVGGAEAAYSKDGKLLPFYQTVKLFQHPHDVLVDDEENLYVCQWNSGQVYPYKFSLK